MNNKVTRIFLLAAALVVWGIIVYRLIVSFSDKSDGTIISNNHPTTSTKQMPDTFSLLLNYADPFLASTTLSHQKIQSTKPIVRSASIPKQEKATTPIPLVKYYGLITNKKTQKLVAIINISGKQYLAKQGEVINNITILKMYNDSILINYGQNKKWIHK